MITPFRSLLIGLVLAVTTFLPNSEALADGHWIWRSGEGAEAGDAQAYFRKEFTDELVGADRVRLFFAADNEASLWINEVRPPKNNGWETPTFADITPAVKDAPCVISIHAKNGGGVAGMFPRKPPMPFVGARW